MFKTIVTVLLAAFCTTCAASQHATSMPSAQTISCYDDRAMALWRMRRDGIPQEEIPARLPAHTPQTERLQTLIAYVYTGDEKTPTLVTPSSRDSAAEPRVPQPGQ